MHNRIQLDVTNAISIRNGRDGATEVVVLDPHSEGSIVIELMGSHVEQLRDALNEYTA